MQSLEQQLLDTLLMKGSQEAGSGVVQVDATKWNVVGMMGQQSVLLDISLMIGSC